MDSVRRPLDTLASQLLLGLDEAERVRAAWALVCGSRTAAHAKAIGYSEGKLTIQVDSAAWMEELRPLKQPFSARLQRLTGVQVADILFAHEPTRR